MQTTNSVPVLRDSLQNVILSLTASADPAKLHHHNLLHSNFTEFMNSVNQMQSFNTYLKKYRPLLSHHYRQFISNQEILQVLSETLTTLRFWQDSIKFWTRNDLLLFSWAIEKYKIITTKIPEEYVSQPSILVFAVQPFFYVIIQEQQDWHAVSKLVPGKTQRQCMFKWLSFQKVPLQEFPWTTEDSEILRKLVAKYDVPNWQEISQDLYLSVKKDPVYRTSKQCREHFNYHLDPMVKKGVWTTEEDIKLLKLYLVWGRKWIKISKQLQGRTDNSVKNRVALLVEKISNANINNDACLKECITDYIAQMEVLLEVNREEEPLTQSVVPLSKGDDTTKSNTRYSEQPNYATEMREEFASTLAKVEEEQYFQTNKTMDQRNNIRYVVFKQVALEELLKEEIVLPAIFSKPNMEVIYKDIVLIEKKTFSSNTLDQKEWNFMDDNFLFEFPEQNQQLIP